MRWFAMSIFVTFIFAVSAFATPITIDFNYSEGDAPDFFYTQHEYRGVGVADGSGSGGPYFVPSVYDSGVSFVNVRFATSSFSDDGYTLTHAGAFQYGTYTLFWDVPIHTATLNFARSDTDSSLIFGLHGGGINYFTPDIINEDTNMTFVLNSSEAFSHVSINAYNSAFLDSVTYDRAPVPEPATVLLLSCGLCAVVGSRKMAHRHSSSLS